jgi:DNA replication protein DnaC
MVDEETPDSSPLKTLGQSFEGSIVERLEDIPCPLCGKPGGWRARILDFVQDMACAECVRLAEVRGEEEERRERIERWLNERSGMTPMLAEWTLDTYPQDKEGKALLGKARKWVLLYLNDRRRAPNLLMWGPVGGGKTGLAWGIIRCLIEEHEVRARLVNFPELLDRMRDSFKAGGPTHEAFGAGTVPVLALDDVGAERMTAWAVEQLLILVDRRKQRLLPTIFTSNFTPQQLTQRFEDEVTGQRIVSRMRENAVVLEVEAKDRRLTEPVTL